MKGFLGTGATFVADLNLLVQLGMGLALLAGTFLARRKRFAAHGVCQTTVLALNLVMIALVMWPSFRMLRPQFPGALRDRFYAVATIHAALGTAAELLGLYIVLVAATSIVPRRLRFQNWKVWMRSELALWWVVVLFGVGTYYVWYMAPVPHIREPAASRTAAGRATVELTNFASRQRKQPLRPAQPWSGSTIPAAIRSRPTTARLNRKR